QYACGISVQSAEKSDYASYAQALFSVSFIQHFSYYTTFLRKMQQKQYTALQKIRIMKSPNAKHSKSNHRKEEKSCEN
ncbi:hypothetical protein, partial [uncultured Ruminococcus sp.]|uniref:hypothetical protein n=4 Tax=Ruminococcus TaxID=1263 RepID=UPI00266B7B20